MNAVETKKIRVMMHHHVPKEFDISNRGGFMIQAAPLLLSEINGACCFCIWRGTKLYLALMGFIMSVMLQ